MRGSDFLSRTEADQNPELLKREKLEWRGKGGDGLAVGSGMRTNRQRAKREEVKK